MLIISAKNMQCMLGINVCPQHVFMQKYEDYKYEDYLSVTPSYLEL